MMNYVLYHKNCPDGFAAAYIASLKLGYNSNTKYIAVQYDEPPPPMEPGSILYILDFSFKKPTLTELARQHEGVLVLDHHKSAREELEELLGNTAFPNLCVTFDMKKCGAVLTFEHFFPGSKLPLALRYIQDRDLWQWQLPNSREWSARLGLADRTFDAWREIFNATENEEQRIRLFEEGTLLELYKQQLVRQIAEKATLGIIGGFEVPIVNTCILQSEVGEQMNLDHERHPFSASYFDNDSKRVYSLRTKRANFDVSVVAREFGGGGHPGAAGFTVAKPDRQPSL